MQGRLNRRVLVIEDDNDIRRLITESLRAAGLDVVAAVDASQALRTALAREPAGRQRGPDRCCEWTSRPQGDRESPGRRLRVRKAVHRGRARRSGGARGSELSAAAVSRPGFEPGTKGLKVPCSTVELAARGVHQV